jgi:hypothetical protein
MRTYLEGVAENRFHTVLQSEAIVSEEKANVNGKVAGLNQQHASAAKSR